MSSLLEIVIPTDSVSPEGVREPVISKDPVPRDGDWDRDLLKLFDFVGCKLEDSDWVSVLVGRIDALAVRVLLLSVMVTTLENVMDSVLEKVSDPAVSVIT